MNTREFRLTLLLDSSSKLNKAREELRRSHESYKKTIRAKFKKSGDNINSQIQELRREQYGQGLNLRAQSIEHDCTIFSSTIMSSDYEIHILPAIEITCGRVRSFLEEIPEYNPRFREEEVLLTDQIRPVLQHLYFADDSLADLCHGARTHFNDNTASANNKMTTSLEDFNECLRPLRELIHELIEHFESYYAAPQNIVRH